MRKVIAILTSLLFAANFLWISEAEAAIDYSVIRVALTSMGTPNNVSVTINGNYTIKENQNIVLEKGKTYQVKIQNGALALVNGDTVTSLGSKFTFQQHTGEGIQYLRVNNPARGWRNYTGNMEVQLMGSYIRFINHVYLETYLYGVVPYEISDSWPLEVLKAQTIAARTYAVSSMSTSSSFDVHDTDSSQVYYGYDASKANAIQAVNATKGKVLKYGSSFAQCYYSSSNGGMIESTKNAWGGSLAYSVVKADPYDVRNPSNPNATWTVSFTKSPVNASLQSQLKPYLKSKLDARGYKSGDNDYQIKSIKSITIDSANSSGRVVEGTIVLCLEVEPKVAATAAPAMQQQTVKTDGVVKNNGLNRMETDKVLDGITNDMVNNGTTEDIGQAEEDEASPEENDVQTEESEGQQAQEHAAQAEEDEAQKKEIEADAEQDETDGEVEKVEPRSTAKAVGTMGLQGTFQSVSGGGDVPTKETIEESVKFTKSNARTIFNLKSTLFTVKDAGDKFLLEGGGYGHGVGMSQYGAQQMAKEGMSCADILNFYYPGTQIQTLNVTPPSTTPMPEQGDDQNPGGEEEEEEQPSNPPTGNDDTQTPVYGTVKVSSSLNIRKGPGTNYAIIGSVKNGTKLEILEQGSVWHKIKIGTLIGYVHGDYVQINNNSGGNSGGDQGNTGTPSTPPPTDTTVPDKRYGVVTASKLNVRTGAGTKNKSIGYVYKGDRVEILSSENGWYKIKYNGLTGYASGEYIRLESSGSNQSGGNTSQPQKKQGVVTASKLCVRTGPGTNKTLIGYLSKGQKVTILESVSGWYKIEYGSGTAYVHGDYVKLVDSSVENGDKNPGTGDNSNENTTKKGTVTASSLSVRKGPGTNYERIGYLKQGENVTIVQTVGDWYKIQYGSGTAYVHGDYVKITGTSGSTSKPDTQTAVVNASALNLRSGPGTGYSSIGLLQKGEKVTILSITGNWAKVKTSSGKTGYCHKSYLK